MEVERVAVAVLEGYVRVIDLAARVHAAHGGGPAVPLPHAAAGEPDGFGEHERGRIAELVHVVLPGSLADLQHAGGVVAHPGFDGDGVLASHVGVGAAAAAAAARDGERRRVDKVPRHLLVDSLGQPARKLSPVEVIEGPCGKAPGFELADVGIPSDRRGHMSPLTLVGSEYSDIVTGYGEA